MNSSDDGLVKFLKKYDDVFTDELLQGLHPKRAVDQCLIVYENRHVAHKWLFHFPPLDVLANKNYVADDLYNIKNQTFFFTVFNYL